MLFQAFHDQKMRFYNGFKALNGHILLISKTEQFDRLPADRSGTGHNKKDGDLCLRPFWSLSETKSHRRSKINVKSA